LKETSPDFPFHGYVLSTKSGEFAITVHPSLSRLAKPSADDVERHIA
jgi:hypothetical protein